MGGWGGQRSRDGKGHVWLHAQPEIGTVVHLMARSVNQTPRLVPGHKVSMHCALTSLCGALSGGRRQSCATNRKPRWTCALRHCSCLDVSFFGVPPHAPNQPGAHLSLHAGSEVHPCASQPVHPHQHLPPHQLERTTQQSPDSTREPRSSTSPPQRQQPCSEPSSAASCAHAVPSGPGSRGDIRGSNGEASTVHSSDRHATSKPDPPCSMTDATPEAPNNCSSGDFPHRDAQTCPACPPPSQPPVAVPWTRHHTQLTAAQLGGRLITGVGCVCLASSAGLRHAEVGVGGSERSPNAPTPTASSRHARVPFCALLGEAVTRFPKVQCHRCHDRTVEVCATYSDIGHRPRAVSGVKCTVAASLDPGCYRSACVVVCPQADLMLAHQLPMRGPNLVALKDALPSCVTAR